VFVGAHDETRKLFQIRNFDGELLGTERYDLTVDEEESSSVDGLPDEEELVTELNSVLDSGYLEWALSDVEVGIAGDVEDRLSELGYV